MWKYKIIVNVKNLKKDIENYDAVKEKFKNILYIINRSNVNYFYVPEFIYKYIKKRNSQEMHFNDFDIMLDGTNCIYKIHNNINTYHLYKTAYSKLLLYFLQDILNSYWYTNLFCKMKMDKIMEYTNFPKLTYIRNKVSLFSSHKYKLEDMLITCK